MTAPCQGEHGACQVTAEKAIIDIFIFNIFRLRC